MGQNVKRMRGKGRGRRKLVQSHLINKSSDVAIIQPSFVMDQLNKNQTWVYDTPGIISDKQVGKLNKLMSVFHASVLLLIMNFVIILSK